MTRFKLSSSNVVGEVREKLSVAGGLEPFATTPEEFAALIRRESDASPQVMCKTLLEAASDFAQGGLNDDITVLAVRLA